MEFHNAEITNKISDKLHIYKPGFVTPLNYTTQVLHHQKKNSCNFKDNLLVNVKNIDINSVLLIGALIFGKIIAYTIMTFQQKHVGFKKTSE